MNPRYLTLHFWELMAMDAPTSELADLYLTRYAMEMNRLWKTS